MALSDLIFADTPVTSVLAKITNSGDDQQKPQFKVDINKPAVSIKNTLANNAAGGGDLAYYAVLTLAGSANTSVDLQNFTNIAGQAAASFARVKFIQIRLLSTEDDAAGTLCSGITIEPHSTNGWTGVIAAAGDKVKLTNGDVFKMATKSAAGWTVGSSNKVLLITNTDGAVSAKVQVLVVGGST